MPTKAPRLIALAAIAVACLILVPAARSPAQEVPLAATPTSPAAPAAPAPGTGDLGEGAWAVIGAAVGAGLAGGLSIGWDIFREWRSDKRKGAAVRALLCLEVGANLEGLRAYWVVVTNSERKSGEYQGDPVVRAAERIARHPLPAWNQLMWKSQASSLSTALSLHKIDALHRHYAGLEMLASYRERLAAVAATDAAAEQAAPLSPTPVSFGPPQRMLVPHRFPDVALAWWPEIEASVTVLLDLGNPLQEH